MRRRSSICISSMPFRWVFHVLWIGEMNWFLQIGNDKNDEDERGKILVGLTYNVQQGSLFVNIKRAAELIGMDSSGFSDPYCKVWVTPSLSLFECSIAVTSFLSRTRLIDRELPWRRERSIQSLMRWEREDTLGRFERENGHFTDSNFHRSLQRTPKEDSSNRRLWSRHGKVRWLYWYALFPLDRYLFSLFQVASFYQPPRREIEGDNG